MEKLAKPRFSPKAVSQTRPPQIFETAQNCRPSRSECDYRRGVEAMKASGKLASKFYGTMAGFPIHPSQGELKLAHKISDSSG
jgi:hypothetical protein